MSMWLTSTLTIRRSFFTLFLLVCPWGVAGIHAESVHDRADVTGIPDLIADPLSVRSRVDKDPSQLPDDSRFACPPQVALDKPLSLLDVVDLSLCHNQQVTSSWANIKIQAAALGEARASYLPTLNASLSSLESAVQYPQNSAFNTKNIGATAYAGLSWRLLDFAARANNNSVAKYQLDSAIFGRDATLQKVLISVISAYYDVVTTRANVDLRADATDFAESTWRSANARLKMGAASLNDVMLAETALAKARLTLARARGDYEKAHAVLIQTMGIPSYQRITLDFSTAQKDEQASENLESLIEQVKLNHPAIKSAQLQLDAARIKVDALRAEGLPTVDFNYNFYQNGYPNQSLQTNKTDTTNIGFTLNIPLFEGFSRTYKIRGAQAQAEQAEYQVDAVTQQVLMDLVRSHADSAASIASMSFAQTLLEAAAKAYESSRRRYDLGAADLPELLSTQNALVDAKQEHVRCQTEWRASNLKLVAAVGRLGRGQIATVQ